VKELERAFILRIVDSSVVARLFQYFKIKYDPKIPNVNRLDLIVARYDAERNF